MNKHPNATKQECMLFFKNENYTSTMRCYHDWQRYIQPLQFLYFLLVEKFIPIKKLSGKEKERLKDIEIRLDLYVIRRRYDKVFGKRHTKEQKKTRKEKAKKNEVSQL